MADPLALPVAGVAIDVTTAQPVARRGEAAYPLVSAGSPGDSDPPDLLTAIGDNRPGTAGTDTDVGTTVSSG